MMITDEVQRYIKNCVLCWLATSKLDNEPNVSPKEVFTHKDNSTLLICNIASPISALNILQNPKVCVSFIDIFIQKGFKLKGFARIIEKNHDHIDVLIKFFDPSIISIFPIKSIIHIDVNEVQRIMAPSYQIFPSRAEDFQRKLAMKNFNVTEIPPYEF